MSYQNDKWRKHYIGYLGAIVNECKTNKGLTGDCVNDIETLFFTIKYSYQKKPIKIKLNKKLNTFIQHNLKTGQDFYNELNEKYENEILPTIRTKFGPTIRKYLVRPMVFNLQTRPSLRSPNTARPSLRSPNTTRASRRSKRAG